MYKLFRILLVLAVSFHPSLGDHATGDTCASPIALSSSVGWGGSTCCEDLTFAGPMSECQWTEDTADLWFSWTPTSAEVSASGNSWIVTLNFEETNFDTVLSVFDGCDTGDQVACNDDAPETDTACGYIGLCSEAQFEVTAGKTYYFQVSCFDPWYGDFAIAVYPAGQDKPTITEYQTGCTKTDECGGSAPFTWSYTGSWEPTCPWDFEYTTECLEKRQACLEEFCGNGYWEWDDAGDYDYCAWSGCEASCTFHVEECKPLSDYMCCLQRDTSSSWGWWDDGCDVDYCDPGPISPILGVENNVKGAEEVLPGKGNGTFVFFLVACAIVVLSAFAILAFVFWRNKVNRSDQQRYSSLGGGAAQPNFD